MKSIIIILIAFIFLATILISNKFLVMPLNTSDLAKITNKSNGINNDAQNLKSVNIENLRIVIKKKERKLKLYNDEKLIKTYKIALGSEPVGDKEIEGDGKTPEGDFYIFTKNPNSKFYLSLGVSYPNIEDAERGLIENLISQAENNSIIKAINEKQTPPQKTKLGGEIYLHGMGNLTDWTQGCVALTNSDIKELFDNIPIGTPVKIVP